MGTSMLINSQVKSSWRRDWRGPVNDGLVLDRVVRLRDGCGHNPITPKSGSAVPIEAYTERLLNVRRNFDRLKALGFSTEGVTAEEGDRILKENP